MEILMNVVLKQYAKFVAHTDWNYIRRVAKVTR